MFKRKNNNTFLLPADMWNEIFKFLNPLDIVCVIPGVCNSWRKSILNSYFHAYLKDHISFLNIKNIEELFNNIKLLQKYKRYLFRKYIQQKAHLFAHFSELFEGINSTLITSTYVINNNEKHFVEKEFADIQRYCNLFYLPNSTEPLILDKNKVKYIHTAIHLAASYGHLEILKELIFTFNVNYNVYDYINLGDSNGENGHPIHQAVKNGHLQIVKFFLDLGVDKDCLTTNSKLTILDIAIKYSYNNCIDYFIEINVKCCESKIVTSYIYNLDFIKKYCLKYPEYIDKVLLKIKTDPYWYFIYCKEFKKEITNEMKINYLISLMEKKQKKEENVMNFLEELSKEVIDWNLIDKLLQFTMSCGEMYYLFKVCKFFGVNDFLKDIKIKDIKIALQCVKKDIDILPYCDSEILKSKRFYLEIYKFNSKILSHVSSEVKNYIFDKFLIKPYQKLINFERNYTLFDIDINFYDPNIEIINEEFELNESNGKQKKRRNVTKKVVTKNVKVNVKKEIVKKEKFDKKSIFIPDVGFYIEEQDLLKFIRSEYPLIVSKGQVSVFIHLYERYAKITFRKMEFVNAMLKKYEDGITIKDEKLELQQCKAEKNVNKENKKQKEDKKKNTKNNKLQ
ncbi:hypothetical protein ABK040_006839 [Willaertia magna]